MRRKANKVLLCVAGLCGLAHAQVLYKVTDLAPLLGSRAGANAINDAGQIAGDRVITPGTDGSTYAIFYDGQTARVIDLPTGSSSRAVSLNARGEVVGPTTGSSGTRAFHYANGVTMELDHLGNDVDVALDINSTGTVVGRIAGFHAAVWRPTGVELLPSIGGSFSEASAVNDSGEIVGWASVEDFTPPHAFLYRNGQMTDLGTGAGYGSNAVDINNAGDAAGYVDYRGSIRHVALFSRGRLIDLGTLGGLTIAGEWGRAYAINDAGVIVGESYANLPEGVVRAFVWRGGIMLQLDKYTDLPGAHFFSAVSVNGKGQILCTGDGSYLLTPVTSAPIGFTRQPSSLTASAGASARLTAAVNGPAALQWQRNGSNLPGATDSSLAMTNLRPADAGLYSLAAVTGASSAASGWAVVGLASTIKVDGGEEVRADIFHANGNVYDQVLLTSRAETITADYRQGQVTRTSFIDLDDDIIQVEFSGPGTLSLVLDEPSGPALPANYNQNVAYMKGHAGLVITGADEHSNLTVFSVGKVTALDQSLFKSGATYDGVADLAFIAITTTNGQFGAIRAGNVHLFAAKGPTGLFAPGVAFRGPVYMGDITAFELAKPVLMIGSASDVRITGGDLGQQNDEPVQVSGLSRVVFTAGADSHGRGSPASRNRAVLIDNGRDVTAEIVVNPTP